MQIESLKEISKKNTVIDGIYVISKCELKPFKQKPGFFLNCELTDKTGSIKGVIWDNAEKIIKEINNKSVVEINGEVTRYNDILNSLSQEYINQKNTIRKILFLLWGKKKLIR